MTKRDFILHYLLNQSRSGINPAYDYSDADNARKYTDRVGNLWHAANMSGAVEEEQKDP